jgi:uncharacterized membrane protein
MTVYELVLVVHVLGAILLLGTGAGIAFFMVMAVRTREPALIAHVAGTVVIADALFTATAAILQPVTGLILVRISGWELSEAWIALSIALYVFTGLFWLPVVWIQIRLRDMARSAAEAGSALPQRFDRLYRIWFAAGFPAFFAVLGIVWLMLTKPGIGL